jgi:MYXO-CTERM domain-containing protein
MTTTGAATGSIGSNTTNGIGNAAAPGSSGTDGSLQVAWNSGTFNYFFSPGEQGNAAFLAALGTTAGATATPAAGTVTFDFTQPPPGTGNYFQLGLVLNYDGNFGQFFGTTVDNGNGTFTTTIPYTIAAHGPLNFFQLGSIYNSNFNTATPFTVDNISVVPEPAAVALASLAGLGVLRRRRSRA